MPPVLLGIFMNREYGNNRSEELDQEFVTEEPTPEKNWRSSRYNRKRTKNRNPYSDYAEVGEVLTTEPAEKIEPQTPDVNNGSTSNLQEILVPKNSLNGTTAHSKESDEETPAQVKSNFRSEHPPFPNKTGRILEQRLEQKTSVPEKDKIKSETTTLLDLKKSLARIEAMNDSQLGSLTSKDFEHLSSAARIFFGTDENKWKEERPLFFERLRTIEDKTKHTFPKAKPVTKEIEKSHKTEKQEKVRVPTGGNSPETKIEEATIDQGPKSLEDNKAIESGKEEEENPSHKYLEDKIKNLQEQLRVIEEDSEDNIEKFYGLKDEAEFARAIFSNRYGETELKRLDAQFNRQYEGLLKELTERLPVTKGMQFETELDGVPITIDIGEKIGKGKDSKHIIRLIKKIFHKSDNGETLGFEEEEYEVPDRLLIDRVSVSHTDIQGLLSGAKKIETQRAGKELEVSDKEEIKTGAEVSPESVKTEADIKFEQIQNFLNKLDSKIPLSNEARQYYEKYRKLGFKKQAVITAGLFGIGVLTGPTFAAGLMLGRRLVSGAATSFAIHDAINLLRDKSYSKRLDKAYTEFENPQGIGTLGLNSKKPNIDVNKVDSLLSESIIRGLYKGHREKALMEDPTIMRLLELRNKAEAADVKPEERLKLWLDQADGQLEKAFTSEVWKRRAAKLGAGAAGVFVGSGAFAEAIGWTANKTGLSSLVKEETKRFMGSFGENKLPETSPLSQAAEGIKQPEIKTELPITSEVLHTTSPDLYPSIATPLEVGERGVIGTLKDFKSQDPDTYKKMMGQLRELYSSDVVGGNNSDDAILTRFALDYESSHPGDLDKITHASIKISPEGLPTLDNVGYIDQATDKSVPNSLGSSIEDQNAAENRLENQKTTKSIDSAKPAVETVSQSVETISDQEEIQNQPAVENIVTPETAQWNALVELDKQFGGQTGMTDFFLKQHVGISRSAVEKYGYMTITDFIDIDETKLSGVEKVEYDKLDQWLSGQANYHSWTQAELTSKPIGQALIEGIETSMTDTQSEVVQTTPTRSSVYDRHNAQAEELARK